MKTSILMKAGLAVLSSLLLAACAANYAQVMPLPADDAAGAAHYKIEPGDVLTVKFYYTKDLSESVTVRPDGMISLQLVDDVKAAGLTPAQLDEKLTDLYIDKIPDKPDISVIVREFSDNRIYVAGEVTRPGELGLKNKMTVLQAITAAGGFKDTANRHTILVVRQDENGLSNVYRLDLSGAGLANAAKDGSGVNGRLRPRDTVFVVKSGIAEADLIMDQFVRQLLLFNGVSLGVMGTYELHDAAGNN